VRAEERDWSDESVAVIQTKGASLLSCQELFTPLEKIAAHPSFPFLNTTLLMSLYRGRKRDA